MRLTVFWLSCDTRPVVQNPVSNVEIGLCLGPQLTPLNSFSKLHQGEENTTSRAKKHNTIETEIITNSMKQDIVQIIINTIMVGN